MFKLAIIYNNGNIEGKIFNTKEEAENYVLQQAEVKRADLRNIQTDERERIY